MENPHSYRFVRIAYHAMCAKGKNDTAANATAILSVRNAKTTLFSLLHYLSFKQVLGLLGLFLVEGHHNDEGIIVGFHFL